MECPDCNDECVAFAVPDELREYAPEEAAAAAICPTCLRVFPAEDGDADPEFAAVAEFFPAGEAGVALALAVGKLGSLALNRAAIEALLARAEAAGADTLLALDRLAVAGSVRPHFDAERRRAQVEQLLA